jgi:hypothetical protein
MKSDHDTPLIVDQTSQAHSARGYDSTIREASISRPGYLGVANFISYVLVFLALAFVIAATIAIQLTLSEDDSGSLLSVASITLLSGSCGTRLHTINLGAHVLLNIIGTLILGSSNYLQQICTSPEFRDIAAEIGSTGDSYFGANSPSRLFRRWNSLTGIWVMLIMTSLPIHLMLNGIIGHAILAQSTWDYRAVSVNHFSGPAEVPSRWTYVSSDRCVQYLLGSASFNTEYTNITVVTTASADYATYLYWAGGKPFPNSPLPKTADVVECYIDPLGPPKCEITLRWFPLLCTALALTIKGSTALASIRLHSHFRETVYNSLGDMIVLGTEHQISMKINFKIFPAGSPYVPREIRWSQALGSEDLMSAVFVWLSASSAFIMGARLWSSIGLGLTLSDRLKRFALGSVDHSTVIFPGRQTPATFPLRVIIANSPQLWLSVGYLLWNNQITRIWMEREWRGFYLRRHRPRVSHYSREIGLRPTRWLQLPYWLTGVLMTLNTAMHWLASQTMFVVEILGDSGHANSLFFVNYSPLAILCIGFTATVLVLGITFYSFLPIRKFMPLMGGSASMVIESSRMLTALLPREGVAWGDISTSDNRQAGFGENVGPLVVGAVYSSRKGEERSEVPDISEVSSSHSESQLLIP